MTHGFYDEQIAASYDETSGEMNDPTVLDPTIDFLARLADDGRALEFAIGTGRVALPLQARGVDVQGIELSQPMVDHMLAKPGGRDISVTIGDMASTQVDGMFQLVYLVYNTITNLLSQEQQVECFCNAAAHLNTGGSFVIEVFVPNLRHLPAGESFVPFDVSAEHVGVDEYDTANQTLISHHYWPSAGSAETFDSTHRYAWPAEYDLMARIAGMSLSERWSNWRRDPFTGESRSHISVWRKD